MAGDQSEEMTLNGAETTTVFEALRRHESDATDASDEEIGQLESEFDRDLDAAENAEFELTGGDATVILSALNEYEVLADQRETERITSLRRRFAEEFDVVEDRPEAAEPMDDERYSGGT